MSETETKTLAEIHSQINALCAKAGLGESYAGQLRVLASEAYTRGREVGEREF